MALLKQSSLPASVVRFSLHDVEAQAQTILADARREAERIIAEARDQSTGLGPVIAPASADEQLASAVQFFTSAGEKIDSLLGQIQSDAVGDLVELSLAIAERVIKRAGLIDPNVLAENLREAMKLVVRASGVRAAVHPLQLQTLKDLLPSLQIDWPALANVEIVQDESITPGGCRVFTSYGQIDADLQSQLDRIAQQLVARRGEA